jgi:hypothetical protein
LSKKKTAGESGHGLGEKMAKIKAAQLELSSWIGEVKD